MKPHAIAGIALTGMLLAAPTASASLVYTKSGDIYKNDGRSERLIAGGGFWQSPSEADDGTILAIRGEKFHRFSAAGAPVGQPFDHSAPGSGALDPKISPDGRLIAYWFITDTGNGLSHKTLLSYSHRFTPFDEIKCGGDPGGCPGNFSHPSWLGSGALALSEGQKTWFRKLDGSGADAVASSDVSQGRLQQDAEIASTGDRGVAVFYSGPSTGQALGFFRVSARGPNDLEAQAIPCEFSGGPFNSPTWSPDGQLVAWGEPAGIYIARVGNVNSDDCNAVFPGGATLAVPNGRQPDWGPFAATGATPGAGGLNPTSAFRGLKVRRGQRSLATGKFRGSIDILQAGSRFRASLKVRRSLVARSKRVTLGAVTKRNVKKGRLRFTITLKRKLRRALARRRKVRVTLSISVTPPGGKPSKVSRVVTVRR